ncbi:MAG: GAF domain-containing protein [Chloroflexi bacterium]|nr:GAF domain-containing protein [Chloroflexota bacterium]
MKKNNDSNPSNPTPETGRVYRVWRERFVLPLLFGVLIFGAIALFPALSASKSALIDGIFIGTYTLVLVTAVFRFSYNTRITVFLLSVYMLGLGELLSLGILGDGLFFFFGLIVFATILLSPRAGIFAMIAGIITFIFMGRLMLGGEFTTLNPNAVPAQLEDWVSAGGALMMYGVVVVIGFQQLEKEFSSAQMQISSTLFDLREERNNLETRVEERTLQLRRINEVERAVAATLDINEILPVSARVIQNQFNFYHTGIYLIDPTGQWAELKEATGESGKLMKEKKHRINLNGKSAIAQVFRSKTGQIVQDINRIRLENSLFPYTRSLILVPLLVGETIFGVIEMHSSRENEFLAADLDAYQNMANGIAIAIENARLFQEAQQSIAEMQATQRQYLGSAWRTLTSEKPLQYALGDADLADRHGLEAPLSLRNQIIGNIFAAGASEWTNEQRTLIEAIATQAALALENARLVEESQYTALQEKTTNEIISKIWASPTMDSILQTAARELGRSLEASEVEIEVSLEGLNEAE